MEWQTSSYTIHILWTYCYSRHWHCVADFRHVFGLSALSMGGSFFSLLLFSLFFISIGLCIIVGPLFVEFLRYRNTEYMISDQRIMAQTGAIWIDTRFVELNKIQEVYVAVGWLDKLYGTGSIVAVTAGFVPVGASSPYIPLLRPALKAVSHPYEVQKLLQEAIRKAGSPKNKI